MFGHGQFEGFRERYGMDFSIPQINENPDEELILRHSKAITPLLNNRNYSSQSANFALLDFLGTENNINDNVIAFFNRNNGMKSLVAFNNSNYPANGSIQIPVKLDGKSEITLRDLLSYEIYQTLFNTNVIQLELQPFESRVFTIQF